MVGARDLKTEVQPKATRVRSPDRYKVPEKSRSNESHRYIVPIHRDQSTADTVLLGNRHAKEKVNGSPKIGYPETQTNRERDVTGIQ